MNTNFLIDEMRKKGLDYSGPLSPHGNRYQRFKTHKDDHKRNGWYIFNDEYFAFGDWANESRSGYINLKKLEEKSIADYLDDLPSFGNSTYVEFKKIKPYKAKYRPCKEQPGTELIIPLYKYSDHTRPVSYQRILPDFSKRFKKGTVTEDLCLSLNRNAPFTLLCEGYATGCTIFEYLDKVNVIICLSADKIIEMYLRHESLQADNIFIASDNDRKGLSVVRSINDHMFSPITFIPQFEGDWNDGLLMYGKTEINFLLRELFNHKLELYKKRQHMIAEVNNGL